MSKIKSTAKKFTVEDAEICFKNFEGKEGQFNAAGRRNFCVLLDQKSADKMINEGWNVKFLHPREEGDVEQPYIQVAVSYTNIPPQIYLVSSRGKNLLKEEDVKILDWAMLSVVDLTVNAYDWKVGDKHGKKAYLSKMYAVIEEDELDMKYTNAPDSAETTIGGCGNCDACDGSCHGNQSL